MSKQRDFFRQGHLTEQAFSDIMHVSAPLRGRLSISQVCWWADVSRLAWIPSQPACRSQLLGWQRDRLGFVFQGTPDKTDRPIKRDYPSIDDQIVDHRTVRYL